MFANLWREAINFLAFANECCFESIFSGCRDSASDFGGAEGTSGEGTRGGGTGAGVASGEKASLCRACSLTLTTPQLLPFTENSEDSLRKLPQSINGA